MLDEHELGCVAFDYHAIHGGDAEKAKQALTESVGRLRFRVLILTRSFMRRMFKDGLLREAAETNGSDCRKLQLMVNVLDRRAGVGDDDDDSAHDRSTKRPDPELVATYGPHGFSAGSRVGVPAAGFRGSILDTFFFDGGALDGRGNLQPHQCNILLVETTPEAGDAEEKKGERTAVVLGAARVPAGEIPAPNTMKPGFWTGIEPGDLTIETNLRKHQDGLGRALHFWAPDAVDGPVTAPPSVAVRCAGKEEARHAHGKMKLEIFLFDAQLLAKYMREESSTSRARRALTRAGAVSQARDIFKRRRNATAGKNVSFSGDMDLHRIRSENEMLKSKLAALELKEQQRVNEEAAKLDAKDVMSLKLYMRNQVHANKMQGVSGSGMGANGAGFGNGELVASDPELGEVPGSRAKRKGGHEKSRCCGLFF
jgi:hypothetical protein